MEKLSIVLLFIFFIVIIYLLLQVVKFGGSDTIAYVLDPDGEISDDTMKKMGVGYKKITDKKEITEMIVNFIKEHNYKKEFVENFDDEIKDIKSRYNTLINQMRVNKKH